jgi:hypothetical protein
MNPLLFVKILTRWEILVVSGACMILIPLVSHLAALRPRRRRIEFVPPAEKVLTESPGE